MANYASYKQISNSQIVDGSITNTQLQSGAFSNWNVKWIYGEPTSMANGCCCLWTVPTGVQKMYVELWGAGGNGHGTCSCNRCYNWHGAQGGYYNAKTLSVTPTNQYTVCAGGVYRCCSRECVGCDGCVSYMNGAGLTNFCAMGGTRGCATNSWSTTCSSTMAKCCMQPGAHGGDFGMGNHGGGTRKGYGGDGMYCHCYFNETRSTGAPFLGTMAVANTVRHCWVRCGCWRAPYGHGGQGAITSYCERCCGQGGTGGAGVVKISYM